jgi:hypothetical protein
MRKLLLVFWLTLPVGAFAYHMGPGQDQSTLDEAAALIQSAQNSVLEAQAHVAAEDETSAAVAYGSAELDYAAALGLIGDDQITAQRSVRLERAKCQMYISRLPEANAKLSQLVGEMIGDEHADQDLLADARSAFANSQFYMTWLMRLEGEGRDKWEPRIESARQTYKLLAMESEKEGQSEVTSKHQEDLEAAIRLARMDLSELQGLPLPSQ